MKIFVWSLVTIALVIALSISEAPSSTNRYLSEADKVQLKKKIESGFALQNVDALYYAVHGYKLTNSPIVKTAEICKFLISSAGDGSSLSPETTYYITTTWNTLGVCQNLPNAAIIKALTTVIEKETSNIPELFYAVSSLTTLSQKLSTAKVNTLVETLQTALKKDESFLNLGYMFHIAANLGNASSFALKRIEDVIVQADEVDGRFLQFEGGLYVTSLLVNGIYKLSSARNKKPPLTSTQVVKLANYFLSRRTVQTPKGVVSLLSSLNILATNEFEKPICIALADGVVISAQQPLIHVKVCDILGKPLSTTPPVSTTSAIRLDGNVEVIDKKLSFQQSSSDKTQFTLNFMDLKPERGFYKISIAADSVKNFVTVKVLSEVVVDYLEIGTADADQTTQPKLVKVTAPNTLSNKIEADYQQKLVIRFLLKDAANKKSMRVHQAFVRLYPVIEDKNIQEVIFVAEPDASNVYKFDMPVGTAAKNFDYQSGEYNVELIIGDALVNNSFQWKVATISLKFPSPPATEVAEKSTSYKQKSIVYTPKPEIQHMFREPEKRPPIFVSNLFTGLCVVPVLVLFILWAKLGVNISNFPRSLSAVIFHLGLASIFALFGIFWLKLNMFVTLRYLIGLGIITFLAGNKLLSHIAQSRKASSR